MSTTTTATTTKFPTAFVSHGAGPSVFIPNFGGGSPFSEFGPEGTPHRQLRAVPKLLGARPKAIVVITAHWESSQAIRVSGRDRAPNLLYDYGGFDDSAYSLQYQAPGDSALAKRIVERFNTDGHDATIDLKRDWDHGVFIPLKVMYPDADIPVIAISILSSYNPAKHIAIGRSLRWLRDEGVLVLGSGSSTHKFPPFSASVGKQVQAFAESLDKTLLTLNGEEREKAIAAWESLPNARAAHPRPDHLMPLLVVVGAADSSRTVSAGRFPGADGCFDVANYVFA